MTTAADKLAITLALTAADAANLAAVLADSQDDWRRIDTIATYTACCYGDDGCQPGQCTVTLESQEVCGITVYRWTDGDDAGTAERGEPTLYRDEAVSDGMEVAENNDETPDEDEQITDILAAGWFSEAVDDYDVRKVVEYIESHDHLGQGHVIIDRDGWHQWVTTGYVERDAVYVSIPHGGYGSWAGCAAALLSTVSADGDE